jgi:hypothetical protein
VQHVDRIDEPGLQEIVVAERFHRENPHVEFLRDGDDVLLEAIVVRVEDVERHLDGVEREPVLPGDFDHMQMVVGMLVPGKPDVAQLAGGFRRDRRLECSARSEIRSASSGRMFS